MKKTKLHLNYAGHCLAHENDTIQGGRKLKIKFNALWGLIQHPEKGWVLVDTGYTERFYDATKRFPNKFYALTTKVFITPEEEVKSQLLQHGILPTDIKHLIITHFHGDHISGLKDFPNATIYTSRRGLTHTLKLPKFIAFSKAVLKDFLPNDLEKRAVFIEETCSKVEDEHFGHKFDLFGDSSIYIYDLPGHAAGQLGVMVDAVNKKYFFISDACWMKKSYEEYILPNPMVQIFFDSWKVYKQTLKRLHDFHHANPEVVLLPTHCSETTDPLVNNKITFDVL